MVLHALLVKDVPATREVLGSLPNVFSALCLNNRGLNAFVECRPFERLFKVLLSPDYLPAMRRRRRYVRILFLYEEYKSTAYVYRIFHCVPLIYAILWT